MNFSSLDSLAEHVKSTILPMHAESMRGRRGGPGRRKAREIQEQEVDELCGIAWASKEMDMSRERAIQKMRDNYGFVEWLFFGWQIYQLIMQIVDLLYA